MIMKKLIITSLTIVVGFTTGCTQSTTTTERAVGGRCEDCELMFSGIPENLSWKTQYAAEDEPGEPMIIRGTIYRKDGKTPAPDVILYVYQTDNTGRYSPGTKPVTASKHGHLRGWIKTDEQGRYELRTIRPASYPNSTNPQHIHPIIKEPGTTTYWVDDYTFEDDPLVTEKMRSIRDQRGGSGLIRLTKNPEGIWIGRRDIILGLHVSNYY